MALLTQRFKTETKQKLPTNGMQHIESGWMFFVGTFQRYVDEVSERGPPVDDLWDQRFVTFVGQGLS